MSVLACIGGGAGARRRRHYLPSSRAFAYALQKENLNFNVLENMGIWKVLQELNVAELITKGEALLAGKPRGLLISHPIRVVVNPSENTIQL